MQTPLSKRDIVATFPMASGFGKFRAFCCEAELDETTRDVIAMPSGFVSDNEDDDELEASDKGQRKNAWQRPQDSTNNSDPRPRRSIQYALKGRNTNGTNANAIANARATEDSRHEPAKSDEREYHS